MKSCPPFAVITFFIAVAVGCDNKQISGIAESVWQLDREITNLKKANEKVFAFTFMKEERLKREAALEALAHFFAKAIALKADMEQMVDVLNSEEQKEKLRTAIYNGQGNPTISRAFGPVSRLNSLYQSELPSQRERILHKYDKDVDSSEYDQLRHDLSAAFSAVDTEFSRFYSKVGEQIARAYLQSVGMRSYDKSPLSSQFKFAYMNSERDDAISDAISGPSKDWLEEFESRYR